MTALFDSHAHVDGPEFDADREEVLARARAAGVERIVVIGAVGDPSSAERSVALAERDPNIWATVATHPHDVAKMTPEWWAVHERLAVHPRVVAIGETGLDYYYDHSPRDVQKAAFARFIELARTVDKPVVCHIRDAHDDARAILREHRASELGCVIHCFTGTPDDARAYAEMGCYVSFSRHRHVQDRAADSRFGTPGSARSPPHRDRLSLPRADPQTGQTQRTGLRHTHRRGRRRTVLAYLSRTWRS